MAQDTGVELGPWSEARPLAEPRSQIEARGGALREAAGRHRSQMSRFASLSIFLFACNSNPASEDLDAAIGDARAVDGMPLPSKVGTLDLMLSMHSFQGDPNTTKIKGGFVRAEGTCTRTPGSPCEVLSCPKGQTEVLSSPGKLHIAIPGGGGEFGWDPGAYPVTFSANAVPWAAGETIALRSDGADVPAFSATLASPNTLDAGYQGPMFAQKMQHASSLRVTWTPAVGEVVVTMKQEWIGIPTTTISCSFAGQDGYGDVPAAAIGKLSYSPSPNGLGDTIVEAWLANTKTVVAGDYAVRVRALRGYSDQQLYYVVQ